MAKCQHCGEDYKVDLNIPDELWEHIKPMGAAPGGGLLCGSCIMRMLECLGKYMAFEAKEIGND
jgi:hypothetical protein